MFVKYSDIDLRPPDFFYVCDETEGGVIEVINIKNTEHYRSLMKKYGMGSYTYNENYIPEFFTVDIVGIPSGQIIKISERSIERLYHIKLIRWDYGFNELIYNDRDLRKIFNNQ